MIYYNFNFYKVIATFYIALLHFGVFGYFTGNSNMQIFVEYFFIVSGIMLAKSYDEKKRKPLTFIINRYKCLIPAYMLFTCFYFVLMYIKEVEEFAYWIKKAFLSFFCLQVLGIGDYGHNFGAVWYVSVLLICSFVLYTIVFVYEEKAKYIVGILCFLGLSYMYVYNGEIVAGWNSAYGIFSNRDVIRGFCDMSIGIILWNTLNEEREYKYAHIWEFVFFALATIFALFFYNLWIPFVMIIVSCYFGLRNRKKCWCYENKVILFLNSIAYLIYLNHPLFVDYQLCNFVESRIMKVVIYILFIIIFAFLSNQLLRVFKLATRIMMDKIRKRI